MKLIKQLATGVAILALAISCKDDELSPYIEPLGNANALGQFVSLVDNTTLIPASTTFYSQAAVDAAVFFDENDQSKGLSYKLQWASIDNRVNIASIELYVEYNETYSDADRNPLIANHGGASKGPSYPAGKFWKTVTPTGARTPVDLTITPNDIYELFKDNTWDYAGNGTKVNIFTANPQTVRTSSTKRFYSSRSITLPAGSVTLAADQFRLRWRLIADDGTAYGSWSNSVCAETVGINCVGQWRVNKDVFNPSITFSQRGQVGAVVSGVRQRPVIALKDGVKDTINIVFNRPIKTPPTVALSAATSTWATLSAPVAYTTDDGIASNSFYVVVTATGVGTGNASVTVSGAVSDLDRPQVTGSTTVRAIAIDNTAPQGVRAWSTSRIGRGQSSTLTVTFNEALSTATKDSVYVSISGQGIDPVVKRRLTLASTGLSGTFLYIYKDSSTPTDVTSGGLTITYEGGKDVAGNALNVSTIAAGGLSTDVSALDPATLAVTVATPNAPTLTLPLDFDQKTQLKWSYGVTGPGSTTGTLYYLILQAGTALPTTFQRTLDVQGVKVYNGYDLTGIASANIIAQGTAGIPVSSGSTGTVFTAFTANGTYDVYAYWVTNTGNISPMSGNLGPFTTTP
jgi:hypothetical protein